jgi:O-antigen/teichoic acid export membrane protein
MAKYKTIFFSTLNSGLFKSSSIYTIASFSNAVIPFLLLPFLTNRLTPGDYGIITMFATVQAFLYPILSFNLEGAVARKFYSKEIDFGNYIGNSFIIFFISTITSLVLFFFSRNLINNYTGIPAIWILIIPIVCAAQFCCNLLLTVWQVQEKPLKYASFQISQSITNAILTIAFILCLTYSWTGRILAISISTILFALISILIIWKKRIISFSYNFNYIKHALKYGGGLIPHALGGMLILMTNRIFLTKMISIEDSGIYGVANQIGSVIGFLTVSFNNAYVPWLFRKLTENKYEDKLMIVKLTYTYFAVIFLIGMLYYLTQPLLFKFFIGENFRPAFNYCLLVTLGFVFQGMYFMVTNYISFAEKTYLQAFVTVTVGLLNIPLNYICIKYYGSLGAAMSFSIIFLLFFLFTWFLSSKVYPMPWLNFSKI